jgi:hypothetical protein
MSRAMHLVALGLVLTVCAAPAIGSDDASEVERAEKIGRLIFEKDRAAWVATDALMSEIEGENRPGIIGWMTVEHDGGWLVQFVGGNPDDPCVLCEVPVSESAGTPRRPQECEPLGEQSVAMFRARQSAIAAMTERCSDRYNTIVLPSELIGSPGGWLVYLLAATTVPGEMVFGGHYRASVSSDGRTVNKLEPLSKGCLTMPPPSEDRAVAAVVSHVLTDTPIETHVFLSLSHGKPIYVVTDRGMWRVQDGGVQLILDGEEWDAYQERAAKEAEKRK